jgi:hypothetical protein
MTAWYCPECDSDPGKALIYHTGGLCPCSDEKGRPVDLVEKAPSAVRKLEIANQRFEVK